jgi:hypothetical protein
MLPVNVRNFLRVFDVDSNKFHDCAFVGTVCDICGSLTAEDAEGIYAEDAEKDYILSDLPLCHESSLTDDGQWPIVNGMSGIS